MNFPIKKVVSAKIFKDTNETFYYLDLTYITETEHDIQEVHIPKIKLPLEYAHIDTEPALFNNSAFLVFPSERFEILPTDLEMDDKRNIDKCFCIVRTIKRKAVEMTLNEIEKKLGYKIKIVND